MLPSVVAPPPADDLYSLSGRIEPTRLSWAYRAGLVVVAIAMLILPLVYLGLIVAAVGAVWWHLTANTWIVTGRGSGGIWRLIAYLGPAVAGSVLAFFMVKPVLARPVRRVDPIPIQPDSEPDLFRFVERTCEQVRAPVPSRIQVDCNVNASASFLSVLALLRPRFVLTIGLPLTAGLTIRQFGGVLAHEFGHFAQGGGMRLTFLVRSINGWFARVVGERDQWDERLEHWAKEADSRISIVFLLAQASVWCSRRILYALMMAGHGISCFMMRQMEYDADSYEIKLVGSAAFIETSARMRELNVGTQIGYTDLREGWVRRTLPSNLPAFLHDRCNRLPENLAKQVRQIPDAKTGLFDTHPSDADRARAAEQANASGILRGGDAPATLLFRNFDALSAAATRHHYEHDLGLSLDSATLVDTEVAVTASLNRQKHVESLQTFFGEHVSLLRPLHVRLQGIESLTAAELIQKLLEVRRTMSQSAGKGTAPYREYEEFDRKLALAQTAQALFESGFTQVEAADFELTQGTWPGANEAAASAGMQLRRLEPFVQRLDSVAAARLACALTLLQETQDPGTGSVLDLDAQLRESLGQEAARLVPSLLAIADAWPRLHEIRRLLMISGLLSANAARSPDPEAASAKLTGIVDRMRVLLRQIRTSIGNTAGPGSDPTQGNRLETILGLESTLDTEIKAPNVINAAISLRIEVAGRLCAIALQVEAAVDRSAA